MFQANLVVMIPRIEKKLFGTTQAGEAVHQFTLTNANGASASLIDYGATLIRLLVPDKNNQLGDVVLGFDELRAYEDQSPYFGATIGRVANRIAHGMFTLDERRYAVPVNNGPHHLHGGFKGYDKRIWTADTAMAEGPSVRFTLLDPDGAEGYPGNVRVTVIFSLTNDNALKIQYFATTDKPTPINLTNHAYLNLKDGGASDVLGHILQVHADYYTPVDADLIPIGKIATVNGTPFDFTPPKPIGKDIQATGGNPAGFDHNLVLRSHGGLTTLAVAAYEPVTARRLEVWTTEPGVQLYTGNFLNGSIKGRNNSAYQKHHAFCVEAQHYPDSINHPKFPETVLHPGTVYRQITEYRFFVGEK
jgi:aldose 1-epimerase